MSKPNFRITVTFMVSGTEDTVSDIVSDVLNKTPLCDNYVIESVEKE